MAAESRNGLEIAKALTTAKRFKDAIAIGERLLRGRVQAGGKPTDRDVADLHRFLCFSHAGDGNATRAAYHLDALFWADPESKPFPVFNDLVRLYRLTGQERKILQAIERVMPIGPDALSRQQIFAFALPKSAGTSLCRSVANALGIAHIASGFDVPKTPHFPAARLGPEIARRAGARRLIHQTHAMPWPENFETLKRSGQPRFLVNVRDPRMATLSYYHMTNQSMLHRLRMVLAVPNYNELDAQSQADRVFELVFPSMIGWLEGWVDYVDRSEGLGIITNFDDFAREPEAVVEDATAFLAGEKKRPSRISKTHFREGKTKAADPLLSDRRREELFARIPEALRERFGWET